MKPKTEDYLQAVERSLSKARIVLGVDVFDQAGRLAYYAMFHAAQALIFERTDRIPKTHKGVNRQFHRFVLHEPGLRPQFAADLSKAYLLKETADYETGAGELSSRPEAEHAIVAAERFLIQIRETLSQPVPDPSE